MSSGRKWAQGGRDSGGKKNQEDSQGQHEQEQARMAEEKRTKICDGSRQRDEGAARKETPPPKKGKGWQSAMDWHTDGQEEATQRRGPKDWPATRPPGQEQPEREQGRAAKRRASWTGKSGGMRRQEDKHKEPGQDHPGKKVPAGNGATETGTSGSAEDRGQPGTKRVKRSGERSMRGGVVKKKRRAQTRRTRTRPRSGRERRGGRRGSEGDNKRRGKKKERRHGLKQPGPRRSHPATGPQDGNTRGGKRTSARSLDWNITEAMRPDSNIRGRSPGLENPGKVRTGAFGAASREGGDGGKKKRRGEQEQEHGAEERGYEEPES